MSTIKKKIAIIGAGRHAAETFEYYCRNGYKEQVAFFLEEDCIEENKTFFGKPVYDLNKISELPEWNEIFYIIAIGSPVRKRIEEKLKSLKIKYDTLISEQIFIGQDFVAGEGTMICPGGIYTVGISIGKHCIINIGVSISHDCKIGNYVTISPGVKLAGKVVIEDEVFLGIGATVIDGIRIGKGAFIAAGACVVKDVSSYEMVAGVPAKLLKKLEEK